MHNKQGGGWTELQTVTHFRNAFREKSLKWYNTLSLRDVDNLNWKNVINQFEQDFRATPTISSLIKKLPEISQKNNASVIQYVS
jgi:hypothetical protein